MRFSALQRQGLVAANRLQQRGMAGGPISYSYKVKKNGFIEEWNGKREITERTFEATYQNTLGILFCVVVIPYGVYSLTRAEFQSKGDRRYKDCV
eukprot:Nitzschia sp. Nitz4//scaffold41_size133979//8362//8765//NITZ4_003326-RA/size133979-snap-gene-0.96-mRNA-1//1//CDS//3329551407//4944//frame0